MAWMMQAGRVYAGVKTVDRHSRLATAERLECTGPIQDLDLYALDALLCYGFLLFRCCRGPVAASINGVYTRSADMPRAH